METEISRGRPSFFNNDSFCCKWLILRDELCPIAAGSLTSTVEC